jgi:bacterioferritin-associated ferredoxin
MYVCICKSVTDKQIRRAAAKGADDLYALRERLGVGSGCGKCSTHAQEILDEASAGKQQPAMYTPYPA